MEQHEEDLCTNHIGKPNSMKKAAAPSHGGRAHRKRRLRSGTVAFGTSVELLGSSLQACKGCPHKIRADRDAIDMSTRYNNGSHYENHQRAAELHYQAAHAHRSAAEQHGKQDHQTGQEHSRQALEHSQRAYLHTQEAQPEQKTGHGGAVFGHDDIAALAHELWRARGCQKDPQRGLVPCC